MNLIPCMLTIMLHNMLDGPFQFKEKQLVLQKGMALETVVDTLLEGIEQKRSQGSASITITMMSRKPESDVPEVKLWVSR